MLKLKFTFIFFVGVILLIGCVGVPGTTPVSPTDSPRPTMTLLPPTPSATHTPEPTVSPTPTPFPTMAPNTVIQQQCLTIEAELPPESTVGGSLVLDGTDATYLLDLQTQEQYLLPTTPNSNIWNKDSAVSPNGKWFAYIETFYDQAGYYQSHQLRIVDAAGQQQKIPNWQEQWDVIIRWLDDERLALTWQEHGDGTVVILNPFTGQAQELLPTFSDLNHDLMYWYAYPSLPEVFYDATLTRVAYLAIGNTYKLGDVQSRKTLWERYAHIPTSRPIWSPDGEHVAVVAETTRYRFELFSIGRDGQETQLTDMAIAYPHILTTWVGAFNWSPDGHYIAFWLNVSRYENWDAYWRLAVVDVSTKQVMDYCILGGYQPPVWSPDGRYLAVNSDGVVVIDTLQNRAFKLGRDDIVIGWMTTEP